MDLKDEVMKELTKCGKKLSSICLNYIHIYLEKIEVFKEQFVSFYI